MNITEIKELLAGTPTAEQLATLAADERKGTLHGDAEIGKRAVRRRLRAYCRC